MRTEEEIRKIYKQYIYKHANALIAKNEAASNQYFGAAIACGRILGKDAKRMYKDIQIAREFLMKKN